MLNDLYWEEYNNGERAFLYSSGNKGTIAYIQKKENTWDCTIYPELIAEEFRLINVNWIEDTEGFYSTHVIPIEEVEWQVTLYIYNRCNKIANQLHEIQDHLPNIHKLFKNIRIKTKE